MQQRLSDKIYEGIREGIIDGTLKGNTFLVESEIAEQYGVSKAPVKAALQMLAQEGFLICFPRRGYMVTTVSLEEFRHVQELRVHLEQLSLRLVIERATDEEIDSLKLAIAEEGPPSGYRTKNTRFHLRLAEIARNPYLVETLKKLLGVTASFAIGRQDDDCFHNQIIEALHRRDLDEAQRLLKLDLHAT